MHFRNEFMNMMVEYILRFALVPKNIVLTELSCKSGIYSERGPKGPDF